MEKLICQLEKNFGISDKEAEMLISDAKQRVKRGESPVDVMTDLGCGCDLMFVIVD